MFMKKIVAAVLIAVMAVSVPAAAFAAETTNTKTAVPSPKPTPTPTPSGGGGGGGSSSGSGSSTGMHASSQYGYGGPGSAGVAGMTEAQKLANGDAWYVDANGNWKYLFASGQLAKGWQLLQWTWNGQTETKWYFFDLDSSLMQTGMTDVNGRKYYLNPISNGFKGMMETGAVNVNGQTLNFATDSGELLN